MTREAPGEPKRGLPPHRRFQLSGVVILVAGLVAALIIYIAAPAPEGDQLVDELGRRQYEFQLERIGGKAMVFTAQFSQWFSSLWHGEKLAYTVAALSTLTALACLWIGSRLATHESGGASDARSGGNEEGAP